MSNVWYDKNAAIVAEEDRKAVAKTNNGLHFVKVHRGTLLDPFGIDSSKLMTAEFDKVSETAFNMYFNYLETKNTLKFTQAERLYREQS